MFVISSYKPFLFEGIKTCSRQHVVVPNATLHWKCILLFKEHDLLISDTLLILGAFHLVKISGISGSAVNGTRFVSSSHWKIPEKVENLKRWARFPGWNIRTECRVPFTFLVVCASSRSTVGHRDVPGFTTKWNNFLPIGNSTFAPNEISGFFS